MLFLLQTASAVVGCLYHLAKNPDKQSKLRDELKHILPHADSKLAPDSLENAPFLRACFKEANRLSPIIAAGFRATGQDIVLKGYQVPKGVSQSHHCQYYHNFSLIEESCRPMWPWKSYHCNVPKSISHSMTNFYPNDGSKSQIRLCNVRQRAARIHSSTWTLALGRVRASAVDLLKWKLKYFWPASSGTINWIGITAPFNIKPQSLSYQSLIWNSK